MFFFQAFEKFKKNPFPWVGAFFFLFILSLGEGLLLDYFFGEKNYPLPRLAMSLIFQLVASGLSVGIAYMGLQEADGFSAKFSDLFAKFNLLINYFLASLVYSFIVGIGLVLLIVPGIMWAIQFGFFPYYIADKNAGPIEALKLSSEATWGHRWQIFKLMLAFIAASILGLLFFVVGLLVVLPLIMIGFALVYRKLNNEELDIPEAPELINYDV